MPFSIAHISSWPRPRSGNHSAMHSPAASVDLRTIPENFGVPDVEDPDPFGVLALERAGLEIKEAGSRSRPASDTFEFRPSPTSPVFRQSYQSLDGVSKRASKRASGHRSMVSIDQGTQTADLPSPADERWEGGSSLWSDPATRRGSAATSAFGDRRIEAWNASVGPLHHDEHDFAGIDGEQGHEVASPRASLSRAPRSLLPAAAELAIPEEAEPAERPRHPRTPSPPSPLSPGDGPYSPTYDHDTNTQTHTQTHDIQTNEIHEAPQHEREEEDEPEEEPIVAQVVQAAQVVRPAPAVRVVGKATVVSPRAKLVTIKGRPAPALPARNPLRQRRRAHGGGSDHLDADSARDDASAGSSLSPSPSPTRSAFDRADEASNPWSEQTSIPEAASKRGSLDEQASPVDADGADLVAVETLTKADPLAEAGASDVTPTDTQPELVAADGASAETVPVEPEHVEVERAAKEHVEAQHTETADIKSPEPRPAADAATEDTPAALAEPVELVEAVELVEPVALVDSATAETASPFAAAPEPAPLPVPSAEATPKLASEPFPSTAVPGAETLVATQVALVAPAEEAADASDTASVSDYGDEEDETKGSDTFHSMPTTPFDAAGADPIEVPRVPALPTAVAEGQTARV